MGVSTTISHALLTIVAITLAVSLAIAVLSQLSTILNTMSVSVKHRSDSLRTIITITNAYYDSVNSEFHIFVKNIGDIPYSDLENIDVYIGSADGALDLYNVSTNNITEYDVVDGVLTPGETIEIVIRASKTYESPYEVKVVFSNGVSETYIFS